METTSANLITIDKIFSGDPVPANKVWAEKVTCSIREQLQLRCLLAGFAHSNAVGERILFKLKKK
jgi:hypothetical protein